MGEEAGETVVVRRLGTVVVVMPAGGSAWDPGDVSTEVPDRRQPVPVAWLQELRTLLDVEHHVVCAPITDPDWLTLPEADVLRVSRVLAESGYRVVVEDPLPAAPHAWADLLEADLQEFLDGEARPLDR